MRARPGGLKQAAVFTVAFCASLGFVAVNLVNPYTVATASSPFATTDDQYGGASVQVYSAPAGYDLAIASESYVAEKKKVAPKAAAGVWAPPAVTPDPGSAKAYAAAAVAARGWPSTEFDCLVALWNRESGWRVNAHSASGAYGIPQALPGSKMASAGPNWETNAGTQIEWGLGYITGRYGTPCGAWGHSESTGWY